MRTPFMKGLSPSFFALVCSTALAANVRAQTVGWARSSSSTQPDGWAYHAMAYDAARKRIVLYGGLLRTGRRTNTTWEWDGVRWTKMTPKVNPGKLMEHAMAYDPVRGKVVLFGGNTINGNVDTTWEWDGSNWKRVITLRSPGARQGHRMAYDPVQKSLLMFGGLGRADTWAYDGKNWTPMLGAKHYPSARGRFGLATDWGRSRVVLHGGVNKTYLGETWEWDGKDWSQAKPTRSPGVRGGQSMAWDANRKAVLLFGGGKGNGLFGDMWRWDGSNWKPVSMMSSAGGMWFHSMAFDAARGEMVLCSPNFQTWVLRKEFPGMFEAYGSGCGTPNPSGLRGAEGIYPGLGGKLSVLASSVAPNARVGVALIGSSRTQLGPFRLPISLAPSMPGCFLLQSADLLAPISYSTGIARLSLPIPRFQSLFKSHFYLQAIEVAPSANVLGLWASNGLDCWIGK